MSNVEPIPAELTDAPDWSEELDEAVLAGILAAGEVEPDRRARWQIEHEGHAEWACRRLAALEARVREVKDRGADWRERVSEWERAELARVIPSLEFFHGALAAYALEQRELDPRRKTIFLPSGEVGTRRPAAPTIRIADEKALLDWLEEHLPDNLYCDVVKVTHEPRIVELRRCVEAREAAIPECAECGVGIEPEPDGAWRHAGPSDPSPADAVELTGILAELDEDHRPQPRLGFEVIWTADDFGDGPVGQVPGLAAELAAASPTVKVYR